MAISDIKKYAHLTDTDVDALSSELAGIRRAVIASLGAADAAYIRRTIVFQRLLDVAARLAIYSSRSSAGWIVGATALGVAKSVENMEIGHNISHGQWDWMNDPEIHSRNWEWDMAGPSSQWRYSHNYRHHVFSNVVGMDEDLGYGVLRVTRDQPWKPAHLLQPVRNLLLAATFEWGIALHDLHAERSRAGTAAEKSAPLQALIGKTVRQTSKDYLLFPALSGRRWRRTLAANLTANLLRNLWAYVVIFCGHFPDGAEKFTRAEFENETPGGVVSATNARRSQLSGRTGDGVPEREPVLPDRTPPVPRSTQQPLRTHLHPGASPVRKIRPALHHGLPHAAVPVDAANHSQTDAARSVPTSNLRRCPRDGLRAEGPRHARNSRDRWTTTTSPTSHRKGETSGTAWCVTSAHHFS